MKTSDITSILGNLSQSLEPVQYLISGAAYILGLFFIVHALEVFRRKADLGRSGGNEHLSTPLFYLFFGAMLIFLPSAMSTMANTAFGSGNILTYAPLKPFDVSSSVGLIIRTGGMLWFIRGCVLVAHSSQPGEKGGSKGLLFLLAGILAMNFENTVSGVNWALEHLINFTLSVKASQGY